MAQPYEIAGSHCDSALTSSEIVCSIATFHFLKLIVIFQTLHDSTSAAQQVLHLKASAFLIDEMS